MRALDSYLKEKLITWLSPAAVELHQITWDDPASLLEKIVAYEVISHMGKRSLFQQVAIFRVYVISTLSSA